MDGMLAAIGLGMGVASSPHCASMCAVPCAALGGGAAGSTAGFQLGRLLGYMAAGAVAASSMAALGTWSQWAPALRPLWTMLQLTFLALGLWWLVVGRAPGWMRRDAAVPVHFVGRRSRPWRAGVLGLAWVAWPCVSLQAALLVAALASGPIAGAAVMATFAIGSLPALLAAPWAWRWLRARRGGVLASSAAGLRIAGAGIVLASGWALTHGLWQRVAGWCLA